MSTKRALERACAIAGSQNKLAERIGTTQGQVWFWLNRARKGVAAEYVLAIEHVTGVSRSELRPDLYPKSEAAA